MTAYTKTINGIRHTIERTLDAEDYEILSPGIRLVQADGSVITPGISAETDPGVKRIVAARDIHTGEWRVDEDGIPIVLFDAPHGTTVSA